MRQFLLALAGNAVLCTAALAAGPTPPPPVTVHSSTTVAGGGTVANSITVHSPFGGAVSQSTSITDKATVGITASLSAGYITP